MGFMERMKGFRMIMEGGGGGEGIVGGRKWVRRRLWVGLGMGRGKNMVKFFEEVRGMG